MKRVRDLPWVQGHASSVLVEDLARLYNTFQKLAYVLLTICNGHTIQSINLLSNASTEQ